MSPIRVGAVSYLNARPLMFTLPQLLPEAEIVVDFPSRLADGLADGRFDAALIPSIEYLRQPGLRIASDAAIACDGPVRSVKLYGRVPIERVRTLALDEGSRTSAALARIMLGELFDLRPRLLTLPLESMPVDCRGRCGGRHRRPRHVGPATRIWPLPGTWARSGRVGPACPLSLPCGPRGRTCRKSGSIGPWPPLAMKA